MDLDLDRILLFHLPGRLEGWTVSVMRIAPQRIDEDADRTARCTDVFDFPRREPIVDGASADTDKLTRLHDRDGFSFHGQSPSES